MVTAKESRTCSKFSAFKPPDLNHMALLQLEQYHSLPCFPPASFNTSVALSGQHASKLRGFITGYQNAFTGTLKLSPSCDISSIRAVNPKVNDLPQRFGIPNKPGDGSCAPQKRYLIFDQSGSRTRLFFSSSFSPQNQNFVLKTPAICHGLWGKVDARVDRQLLVKPEEKREESELADGEDEMLETSEEIDALLDSDTEDGSDDDEVTSTGHTLLHIEEGYGMNKLLEELKEEVASSDDLPKRQRLLDGSYKKSSSLSVDVKPDSSCNDENDVESSCVGENGKDDITKKETKVKIHNALKILESILPGSNINDPLSIIDKAIVYLKTMKVEAEALGLGDPRSESTFS